MSLRTEWADEAYSLSLQGLNSTQIYEQLIKEYRNITQVAVRSCIKRERKRHGTQRGADGRELAQESHKVRDEGRGYKVFDDIVECDNAEDITPQSVMESKGLDPTEWEVISFVKNTWQQQTKDGDKINLCQSKLTVKPIKHNGITLKEIEDFLNSKDFSYKVPVIPKTKYNEIGSVLEIDLADAHFGLLSYGKETGENFDLKIAQERFRLEIAEIIERANKRTFTDIYLISLGDLMHVDNDKGETTKGTRVDYDARNTKIFEKTFDSMQEAFAMLRTLNAKIHYVFVVGNHDRNYSYPLAFSLKLANPDIDFDISPNPMKVVHFNNVLIGVAHGDYARQNKGSWLLDGKYRKLFADSDYVEEHCGHIHNEVSQVKNGIMCRSVTSMCGQSYYDHQQGYVNNGNGIMSFVWDKENGLKEIWFSMTPNIEEN